MNKFVLALGCVLMTTGFSALADDMAPAKPVDTPNGQVLANAKGMTLYTFDKDSGDKSSCSGGCAVNWPPLMAAKDAKASGDWTLIKRDDGAQWAYKGHPLYTFSKDAKTGDTMGNGVGGFWHVAKP